MSDTESFIEEVTEEVRRDRLFGYLKRYGWIGVVGVFAIVGGAAFNEWNTSQKRSQAEAFGDSILSALRVTKQEGRLDALSDVATNSSAQIFLKEMIALSEEENTQEAVARWSALGELPDLPQRYRDLALIKVQLAGGTGEAMLDSQILEALAKPGAPYRALALELQAVRLLQTGERAAAIVALRAASEDSGVTDIMRRRTQQILEAIGAAQI